MQIEKVIEELNDIINDLKCCGNCKNSNDSCICSLIGKLMPCNACCPEWEVDNSDYEMRYDTAKFIRGI